MRFANAAIDIMAGLARTAQLSDFDDYPNHQGPAITLRRRIWQRERYRIVCGAGIGPAVVARLTDCAAIRSIGTHDNAGARPHRAHPRY